MVSKKRPDVSEWLTDPRFGLTVRVIAGLALRNVPATADRRVVGMMGLERGLLAVGRRTGDKLTRSERRVVAAFVRTFRAKHRDPFDSAAREEGSL